MELTPAQRGVLMKMSLFENIRAPELDSILNCLGARAAYYRKDELIAVSGGAVNGFGVVLSGPAQVLREDVTGRQTIVTALGPGDTFAEVLVCAGIKKSPVTVRAAAETEVLFLGYERVLHSCSNACAFHSQLVRNMLRVLAQKNLDMNRKIGYLMLRGMRRKLAAYLLEQCPPGGGAFTVPFSREELADFLGVDRSAMSRELGRMRDEGLIDFEKNRFRLLDAQALSDTV